MATIPKFDDANLQAICNVLGETDGGLTGSEIGRYLAECGIDDPIPHMTKRHRLFAALKEKQVRDACANNIGAFILHGMKPVLYHDAHDYYDSFRARLNPVLAFSGLCVAEDGTLRQVTVARTISEAEQRAGTLRKALRERAVHPDVLEFCRAELLEENYFHAVFEATKSVADKIRRISGVQSDGSQLADAAFGLGASGIPCVAFNSLQTETERSEHKGLAQLIKGLFGAFRNTTAHAPKIHWNVTEQDALDILTLTSLVHRRLDNAVRTDGTRIHNGQS